MHIPLKQECADAYAISINRTHHIYVRGAVSPTEENLKEAAADFATNWASSPGHYANIVNPKATMQGLKVVAVYEYNENFQMYGWGFYAANIFAG